MQIMGALQANEILKKKSKDKTLNSSPVCNFFDKYFLASSPNKILVIDLSESNLRELCNALE